MGPINFIAMTYPGGLCGVTESYNPANCLNSNLIKTFLFSSDYGKPRPTDKSNNGFIAFRNDPKFIENH